MKDTNITAQMGWSRKKGFWAIAQRTLRKIYAKTAEDYAVDLLLQLHQFSNGIFSNIPTSEEEIRQVVQETIVPAYYYGWLNDIYTVQQLQEWINKSVSVSYADPLLSRVGLMDYWRLRCMSCAVAEGIVDSHAFLLLCPVAPSVHPELFTKDVLEAWRPGASLVLQAIQQLHLKSGIEQWMQWVETQRLNLKHLPPLDLDIDDIPESQKNQQV